LNVESEEIEIAINELEVRLERLRALYEQYFLGFEKIEPTVARKDVDRRIYVLRREKIRNTARRFRLQNIIQRYNTFQQYWQRICREIENGTYKRHLLRAERTVGPTDLMTAAARRRFGKERERSSAPPAAADEADSAVPARRSVRPAAARSSRPSAASSTPAPAPVAPPAPRAPGAPPPPPRRPPPLPPGATAKLEAPSVNASVPAGKPPTLTRAPGAPGAPPPPRAAPPPPPRPAVPAAKPQGPSEQVSARPVRPAPAERPAAAAAARADPKARELHERLVAASKAAKRPAVSLESLEKTMKSTEASLRAKHPNRRIEFDIVLKDGKPVLKPIVR
jgi:hypothetical protein